MSGLQQFFQQLWREILGAWELFTDFMITVFEPSSGLMPKVIFGIIVIAIIFWVSRRVTGSK